uniref:Inhibitor of growth protein 3 n=1 Tax=Bactrocera latifrons TaxID=174628 RepID=A0A0K8VDG4_BACLA
MLPQPLKAEAHEKEHPTTSSAAVSCLSTPLQPTKTTNSIATQYSYSSIYDNVMLTPPDLPSDEDEVLCYNSNEPRYCICNQVSYGSMIACDNKLCPYEWFHFQCVGVIRPPKGKWYCPLCKASMQKSRGSARKRKIPW